MIAGDLENMPVEKSYVLFGIPPSDAIDTSRLPNSEGGLGTQKTTKTPAKIADEFFEAQTGETENRNRTR